MEIGIRYRKYGNHLIYTPGLNWGPKPLIELYTCKEYAIWKCAGHAEWNGRLMANSYYPSEYMLVRLDGDFATQLLDVEPGHKWRATLDCLIEMVRSYDTCRTCPTR